MGNTRRVVTCGSMLAIRKLVQLGNGQAEIRMLI